MEITELEHNKTHKYLGLNEADGIKFTKNREKKNISKENSSYMKNKMEWKKLSCSN